MLASALFRQNKETGKESPSDFKKPEDLSVGAKKAAGLDHVHNKFSDDQRRWRPPAPQRVLLPGRRPESTHAGALGVPSPGENACLAPDTAQVQEGARVGYTHLLTILSVDAFTTRQALKCIEQNT